MHRLVEMADLSSILDNSEASRHEAGEQLIEAIRVRPCLWDAFHADHSDRSKSRAAWIEVAQALHPNFDSFHPSLKNASVLMVMKRWRNMRDSYVKDLRNWAFTSSSRSTKRRKYIYFEQLSFLRPSVEQKLSSKIHTFSVVPGRASPLEASGESVSDEEAALGRSIPVRMGKKMWRGSEEGCDSEKTQRGLRQTRRQKRNSAHQESRLFGHSLEPGTHFLEESCTDQTYPEYDEWFEGGDLFTEEDATEEMIEEKFDPAQAVAAAGLLVSEATAATGESCTSSSSSGGLSRSGAPPGPQSSDVSAASSRSGGPEVARPSKSATDHSTTSKEPIHLQPEIKMFVSSTSPAQEDGEAISEKTVAAVLSQRELLNVQSPTVSDLPGCESNGNSGSSAAPASGLLDEDLAFFYSILPLLKKFNVDQKLDFRLEVMRILQKLRNSGRNE